MHSQDINDAAEWPLNIALPDGTLDGCWTGWKIWAIDHHKEEASIFRLNVFVDPADGSKPKIARVFEFRLSVDGTRASDRFRALALACGIRATVRSTRELEGRYFAARNRGASPSDFGPLELALKQ
ncbi:hypothetical protein [Rhizobium sp. 11_C7_N12_5]|uniref:hypothetical protein n=1 Tax=Rhizobium sp. 11_C7_N12_5 TaxID=3240770 RepID=UPI003F22D24E